jgi:hypothetical protein
MSDGPHRSLPMRPGWKRVAERADNANFEAEDVARCVVPALEQDCSEEMSPAFINDIADICRRWDRSLFKPDMASEIEALRANAGCGIGRLFLDSVARLSATETADAAILVTAMTTALNHRGACSARQVEEHYYRKSTESRAINVRARLEQAVESAPTQALARKILKLDEGRSDRPTLKKGLEDGVRI